MTKKELVKDMKRYEVKITKFKILRQEKEYPEDISYVGWKFYADNSGEKVQLGQVFQSDSTELLENLIIEHAKDITLRHFMCKDKKYIKCPKKR